MAVRCAAESFCLLSPFHSQTCFELCSLLGQAESQTRFGTREASLFLARSKSLSFISLRLPICMLIYSLIPCNCSLTLFTLSPCSPFHSVTIPAQLAQPCMSHPLPY